MDAQAQLQEMAQKLNQLEATNAQLLQFIANRTQETDEEAKFYKRIAAHKPKTYDGEADPVKFEDWIFYMEKLLEVVGCPENLKVKLASFYLEGPAELWWRTLREAAKRTPTTPSSSSGGGSTQPFEWDWDTFLGKLKDRFYPLAVQKQKETEFLFFRQHSLNVTQYANKFLELSRFAPTLVSTEQSKMSRFYDGLNFKYQKLIGKCDTFQELYEQALEKERVCLREEEVNRKRAGKSNGGNGSKRPNYGGNFEGNQNQSRPQNQNQTQRPQQTKNPNPREFCQQCKRWHSRGVNCEGKMVCLNCRKPGHIAKNCWSDRGQGRGNPGASGSRWPTQQRPQGGNPNQLRLEYQGGGRAQSSGAQGTQRPGGGKLFTITTAGEAGTSSAAKPEGKILSGIFLMCGEPARVLFDSGADRSYISSCLANKIRSRVHVEACNYCVRLPDGSTLACNEKLCACMFVIQGREFSVDLLVFDLGDFDVVLGMDWLSENRAIIECFERNVIIRDGVDNRVIHKDEIVPDLTPEELAGAMTFPKGRGVSRIFHMEQTDPEQLDIDRIRVV